MKPSEEYHYQTCPEVAEFAKALLRRKKLLASPKSAKTCVGREQGFRGKAENWREMVLDYLGELCDLQLTFDSGNQRYFDGQTSLFPASAHVLLMLIDQAEKLVSAYNRDLAVYLELLYSTINGSDGQESEIRYTIDLTNLRNRKQGASTDQAAYLVDMAKAEALDMMGETDREMFLVDQHL